MACILDRDRHKELIAKVPRGRRAHHADQRRRHDRRGRHRYARTREIDIYLGSGGAPEGVLAAAALRCIGGQMQGRLMFENDEQIAARARDGPRRPEAEVSRSRRWRRAT